MRIVLEQSGHAFGNLGDWAMVQVAVGRFRALFPGCEILVFCRDENRARQCIPEATPLSSLPQTLLFGDGPLLGRLGGKLWNADRHLLRARPRTAISLIRLRHRLWGHDVTALDAFIDRIPSADLVMATGGGYITDEFPDMVEGVCGVLLLAQRVGTATAMLGQGLGPLKNPKLRKTASEAMRNLRLLSLRESVQSPRMARGLGVPQDRTMITGDDAVELAYSRRPPSLGEKLGLNVRVAAYSSVGTVDINRIREAVGRILQDLGVAPQILPISLGDDWKSTAAVLPVGACGHDDSNIKRPEDVIRLTGECRLVITGSYHAGVFALSQGVSVLGLAKSDYYAHKFDGLAAQFGRGCRVVQMGHPEFPQLLHEMALHMWKDADQCRQELLNRASDQIQQSVAAYDRVLHFMK